MGTQCEPIVFFQKKEMLRIPGVKSDIHQLDEMFR